MKQKLEYLLQGFGFVDGSEFMSSTFKILYTKRTPDVVAISTATAVVMKVTGLHAFVFLAFIGLMIAEFYSGVKAARKVKRERFKSRKAGRMLLKIGVYLHIIITLNVFAMFIDIPDVMGFPVNPFVWLYYIFIVLLFFQYLVSYLENLSMLGYAESKKIIGVILRKMNKYFEFDGTKENDNNEG